MEIHKNKEFHELQVNVCFNYSMCYWTLIYAFGNCREIISKMICKNLILKIFIWFSPIVFFPWYYPQIYIWDICVVAKSCPTLYDPMDYSLPGSPVHGIFQARILEWITISSSRGSSWPSWGICRGIYPYISYGFFYSCFSSWCILYSLLLREKYNH